MLEVIYGENYPASHHIYNVMESGNRRVKPNLNLIETYVRGKKFMSKRNNDCAWMINKLLKYCYLKTMKNLWLPRVEVDRYKNLLQQQNCKKKQIKNICKRYSNMFEKLKIAQSSMKSESSVDLSLHLQQYNYYMNNNLCRNKNVKRAC
ncbi:hypothetical protein SNEBB_010949 [Seison nebaliae]|nr:hypothetical protein SNEBB_010949 [Seison nebaliae]